MNSCKAAGAALRLFLFFFYSKRQPFVEFCLALALYRVTANPLQDSARPRGGTISSLSGIVMVLFVSLRFTNNLKDERQTEIRFP